VSEKQSKHDQKGVSYVELLVVIVIIGIVAGLAVMGRGNANEIFRRQNVAYGLKNAFERARFDSVKRRPDVAANDSFVSVNNLAFTLRTDRDGNGVVETLDDLVTGLAGQGITIRYLTEDPSGSNTNMPATVKFNFRGEPDTTSADGNPVAPAFLVCNEIAPPHEQTLIRLSF